MHIQVRTVGGGEPWDTAIATTTIPHSNASNTIGQALANRDINKQAQLDEDYERIDTSVVLLVCICFIFRDLNSERSVPI